MIINRQTNNKKQSTNNETQIRLIKQTNNNKTVKHK